MFCWRMVDGSLPHTPTRPSQLASPRLARHVSMYMLIRCCVMQKKSSIPGETSAQAVRGYPPVAFVLTSHLASTCILDITTTNKHGLFITPSLDLRQKLPRWYLELTRPIYMVVHVVLLSLTAPTLKQPTLHVFPYLCHALSRPTCSKMSCVS